MAIPPEFLEDLRNRIPVSDVVRRHVQLRKQGREWAGLSPFNKEKTASFFVNDDKRFYHCFSSGKHGDAFTFLMDVTGQTFREAVESVASMAGMDVPSDGPEAEERRRITRGVQETLSLATDYYESQLRMPAGREALDYLHGRGLDDATIRRFRLGFAPPAYGSLAAGLAADGVTKELLVDAGLMKLREDGRFTDYFHGRVMFPITDRQGKVIAFGGRVMGDGQPKYLNSPETAAFHKGSVLYGLAQAREAAHKSGRILVVEGYMDVIALAQAGIAEAVAPLGTALGEDQIRLLWTLAAEPVLCLDGDRAGKAAAIRGAERAMPLLQPGRSLRFAMLPAGEDPDTLVRKAGAGAIDSLIEVADSLEAVIWQAEWDRNTPTSPERRAAFHRAILSRVKQVGDETVRSYYEQSIREKLRETFAPVRPATDTWQDRGFRQKFQNRQPPPVRRRADPRRLGRQRERALIGLLALNPEVIGDVAEHLAQLNLGGGALDTLRNRIIGLGVMSNNLDAAALASQLSMTTANRPTEEDAAVERELAVACDSAKAVLGGSLGEGQEALTIARRAIEGLIEALEHDTIRADIAGQVEHLGEAPETLDRLEASVAAERTRTPTEL
jgi:DNA primase